MKIKDGIRCLTAVESSLITQEIAGKWLLRNIDNNRPILASSLKNIKADMLNGNFTLSPDMITFNTEGKLVNGQHRLHICKQTGISFRAFVWVDAPPEAILIMDQGRKRSSGDAIIISGMHKPINGSWNRRFAVVRAMCMKHSTKMSINEELGLLNRYLEGIEFSISHCPRKRGITSAILWAVISKAYYYNGPETNTNYSRLQSFCRSIFDGCTRIEGDEMVIRLRTWLMMISNERTATSRAVKYNMIQTVLKAYMENKNLQRVNVATHDLFDLAG